MNKNVRKEYEKIGFFAEGKLTEGKVKFNDVKSGTKIDYGMGTIYQVVKNDGRRIYMTLRNAGRFGGLFAPKTDMDKSSYESQVKVRLIKNVVTAEEQADAENVSEETILAKKVSRLKEMGYKITKEGEV
tara:strand:- start:638 stop:1027 length:390 start_codon:yes stop_codon:yes gene_type:complete